MNTVYKLTISATFELSAQFFEFFFLMKFFVYLYV